MDFNAATRYLREMAFRLELANDHFRCTAYTRAAETLAVSGSLAGWAKLPGIGKSIKADLELVLAGQVPQRLLDLQVQGPPASIMDLLLISGIGVKRALALHQSGISSMESLFAAVRRHTVSDPALVHAVYAYKAAAGAVPLAVAEDALVPVINLLRAVPAVDACGAVGAFRLSRPELRGVDVLVALKGTDMSLTSKITDFVVQNSDAVLEPGAPNPRRFGLRVPTPSGPSLPIRLTFCTEHEFGCATLTLTGPTSFVDMCKKQAQAVGLVLDEFSLSRKGVALSCHDELDVFEMLGVPFVSPEHRERLADLMQAPEPLSTSDLIGDLHIHSQASTGLMLPKQIQEHGKDLGYKVVGISDNFRSFGRGVIGEAAAKHKAAIRACAGAGRVPVIAGAKVDIRLDGSLEVSGDDLTGVKYVLLAISADPGRMTMHRYEAAVSAVRAIAPGVAIAITHPGNRRIGERGLADLNWASFFRMCAANNVAVDVSGDPYRADPGDAAIAVGAKYKCKFLLGSEARTLPALSRNITGSVAQANRAALTKSDILNMSTQTLKHWLSGSDLRRLG